MDKNKHLKDVIKAQKRGVARGIYSLCTANELVIGAAMEKVRQQGDFILIESTCNQVNQYGGYTGMKPEDFMNFIQGIALQKNFSAERLIIGGDHLGPNPWKKQKAELAMEKAGRLIEDYVLAGYTKIHIDPSMHLADDPGEKTEPLDASLIAARGAELALKAEDAYRRLREKDPQAEPPVYVIGTEVPTPGGTDGSDNKLSITGVAELNETINTFKGYFINRGLEEAWQRVIAVVVQPGVEFGTDYIIDYKRGKAGELSQSIADYPGIVFEAHSTDYQRECLLKQMVEDGFCILKVGPALTFAFREALFLLEYIERELWTGDTDKLSNLQNTLEAVMLAQPEDWQNYYQGNSSQLELARKYSLSDRIRYYWSSQVVKEAKKRLINNLQSIEIPLTMISQFMPGQYRKIREGRLNNDPLSLIEGRITDVLNVYERAVNP